MRMSFNVKALGAFRNLGAVALITATLAVCFTACKQAGGSGGGDRKPTPKYSIAFRVRNENGTLKAKAEGIGETNKSPIKVEEGKTITFTAKANAGYRVKGWTLDGKAVNGTNTEYKLKVSKPATVKVSFEAIPPTKYTVTLTQTEHGTVTASPEIPADKLMPKDTVITFTAKADDGYKIGKWTVTPAEALQAGGADGSLTAKVKITADTQVSVNFELIPEQAVLTLSPNKLTIGISAKTADGKPIEVEGCTETTFASDEDTELHATGTTVTLRGKITKLECNNNQLVALNVKNLTSLEELLCRNNQVTSLDASGLTSLKTLGCNGNKLASLNVSGCTALKMLGCFRNQLASLNVQGLTSLEALGCQGNQLTTVDISGLTALKRISCHNNKINAQEMTKLLKALPTRVASNDVKATLYTEKTEPAEENCKDFSQSETLKAAFKEARGKNWKLLKEKTDGTEVDILFTYAINFGVEGGHGTLKAKADGITETETSPINVEEGKTVTFTAKADDGYKVKEWKVDGNVVAGNTSDTYTHNVTKAVEVKVSFELRPVEGGAVLILSPDKLNINIRVVTDDGSAITVEGCNETTLANNVETELHAKGTKVILKGKITGLDCRSNQLPELNVQGLTSLQKLNCFENQLPELNVQGLTALKELWCNNNKLTALDVQGLTSLQYLYCSYNQLTSLNVQGLTALQELNCSDNKLTALNVQGLTALKTLVCYENQLPELNVQGLTALKELWCNNNKLTALDVQGLTSLQYLYCWNNQLTALNVQGLTNLVWFECSKNQLNALNIQDCTSLERFECYSNQLNAQTMTELLKALPAREASDDAYARLYTEKTGAKEGNCKDFSQPADLKKAFEGAKGRNWKLKKINASGSYVEI